jgi:acetyltransferase-like isoleucine patch superfamily enzyme
VQIKIKTIMILNLIKNTVLTILTPVKKIYRVSKLSYQNPTCRFDISSHVVECEFEKHVVIFDNCKLFSSKIGAYSYIQMNGRIFHCTIGKFCSIASSVSIAPGMHDMSRVTTHPSFYFFTSVLPKIFVTSNKLQLYKKVTIGHDVWIGEKVVILDGVTIGNGAVIASGAIVIKDVEPYEVVGGVPAKHIKYRFDKQTIEIIHDSQWWNYSDEWFEKNHELMLNTAEFIEYLRNDK